MRINLMSDLHLEFEKMPVPEGQGTLILAGDIHTGTNATDFIAQALDMYDNVLYVLGNHEFYNNDYNYVTNWWVKAGANCDRLHVLHNNCVVIKGIKFVGTTLWTDANTEYLNDYRYITINRRWLTADDTRRFHREAVDFLWRELDVKTPTVVITHHAPVKRCVRPRFYGDYANLHFHADLDLLIKETKPMLWLHGHMHDNIWEVVEDTLIVCNPKGYRKENPDFIPPLVLDIPTND